MGFRVWGLGFRVQGLGFKVFKGSVGNGGAWVIGFRVWGYKHYCGKDYCRDPSLIPYQHQVVWGLWFWELGFRAPLSREDFWQFRVL